MTDRATDTGNPPHATTEPDPQPLEDRGSNRSQRPTSQAFREFIAANWGPRPGGLPERLPSSDSAAAHRAAIGTQFGGERLVIPAGALVVRSNDTDYRFRPHSAFAHLTGLGTDQEPDAVLVLDPNRGGESAPVTGGEAHDGETHTATLYFRPRAGRDTEEFYANARYGELWVGVRPSLEEIESATGLNCAHIDSFADAVAKDAGQVTIRVVPQADTAVTEVVRAAQKQAGVQPDESLDAALAEKLSELRLIKDEWEISEMQKAVDVTCSGFEHMIRALPRATVHPRGERVIEGAFAALSREEGNGLGYDTIAASGNNANTLHWIVNDGPVRPGDLVLIDAGVEVDSLYTADITRTLPVDGRFTEPQKRVYQAVLDAAEASMARAREVREDGTRPRFRELHEAAMEVLAHRLAGWGMLPVSAEESLAPEGQYHRRWMVHGTSHHLGIDVHDCAQARRDMYLDAELRPGMIFTIEPGLYFRADDLAVPEDMRGMAVRIEDNILVTEDGAVRLSEDIPRTIDDVENWMREILAER
ncbi:MAG TPA: aminopeptidase P family protein [Actinomycetaceae bacterium]|nr:aminopeptidase P family protein [Actinomycetaceae bacterium]